METITWESVPDYDTWGIDEYWNCDQWVLYHKALANHFGKPTANQIWDYAYAKSGNLSNNLNCRSFNSNFRKYVKDNGLNPYSNAGIFSPVLQGYGAGSDILSGAINTTSNVASGLFSGVNTLFKGNNIKTILTVALIAGGVIGVAYTYKSFKK